MIIGLDVGGTHTDAVLLRDGEMIKQIKVSTDSADLLQTVLSGLEAISAGIDPADIRRAVLSTTLATNLVARQDLPPVGMIVSAGPGIDPQNFRTNEYYHIVAGALDHRGKQIQPLDEQQIQRIGQQFKSDGIRYAPFAGQNTTRRSPISCLLSLPNPARSGRGICGGGRRR